MKTGVDILVEHSHDLKWMISDQALHFDDYLLLPYKNRDAFVKNILEFLKYESSVPPETLVDVVNYELSKVLSSLESSGEDMDRLACWLLSMKDTGQANRDSNCERRIWSEGFDYWSRKGLPCQALTNHPSAAKFVESYIEQVAIPWQDFFDLTESSGRDWIASRENRTTLDQFLYSQYYEETETRPDYYFSPFYQSVLQRCWWQKNESLVDPEALAFLLDQLSRLAYDGTSLRSPPDWVRLASIPEAFSLNEGHDFAKCCRDW